MKEAAALTEANRGDLPPRKKSPTGATDRRIKMEERYNPMKSAEIAAEHNYNMIDGVLNNQLPALPPEREKKLDKVKEPPNKRRSREREER